MQAATAEKYETMLVAAWAIPTFGEPSWFCIARLSQGQKQTRWVWFVFP
jgi:hypothetical protein